jgi:nucleoside-diphosphate-sugar epimerase
LKKVLITGATGFIGSHCLPLLFQKGYEIHAVSSKAIPNKTHSKVHWHRADLLEPTQLLKLVESAKATHLLHLAWYVAPGKWMNSIENYRWVQASLSLLKAFSLHGGQRALFAGTCAEYDWRYSYCSEDLTPLSPTTFYGTCKHALQILLSSFSKEKGLSSAWGRIFFLYGPHEHPVRLVSSVIRSLLLGKPARCSHGNQLRDYLYVADVADTIVRILESDVQGPINIASGYPVSLKEIVYRIAEKLDRKDLVHLGALPAPPDEPELVVGNTRRLTSELGWRPKYDLNLGLEETIDWWKNLKNAGQLT